MILRASAPTDALSPAMETPTGRKQGNETVNRGKVSVNVSENPQPQLPVQPRDAIWRRPPGSLRRGFGAMGGRQSKAAQRDQPLGLRRRRPKRWLQRRAGRKERRSQLFVVSAEGRGSLWSRTAV